MFSAALISFYSPTYKIENAVIIPHSSKYLLFFVVWFCCGFLVLIMAILMGVELVSHCGFGIISKIISDGIIYHLY